MIMKLLTWRQGIMLKICKHYGILNPNIILICIIIKFFVELNLEVFDTLLLPANTPLSI